jgi:hypothetical protein
MTYILDSNGLASPKSPKKNKGFYKYIQIYNSLEGTAVTEEYATFSTYIKNNLSGEKFQ